MSSQMLTTEVGTDHLRLATGMSASARAVVSASVTSNSRASRTAGRVAGCPRSSMSASR